MKRIVLIALVALAGCTTLHETRQGKVHHVVLCWLKDSGNAAQRQQIIEASRSFSKIPGVLDVRVGEPIPSDRSIVDDSFDVAVPVTFADVRGLETYQNHPLHKKAGAEILMPLARKVVVYDFRE